MFMTKIRRIILDSLDNRRDLTSSGSTSLISKLRNKQIEISEITTGISKSTWVS